MNYTAILTPHSISADSALTSSPTPGVGPREFFALRGWMITDTELERLEALRAHRDNGWFCEAL